MSQYLSKSVSMTSEEESTSIGDRQDFSYDKERTSDPGGEEETSDPGGEERASDPGGEERASDPGGEERTSENAEKPKAAAAQARFSNLYRFDLNKCREQFKTESFDKIVELHTQTVKCIRVQTKTVDCKKSKYFSKGERKTFTTEQVALTQSQEEAGIGKRKNAFSITYFEANDKKIYVAGNGPSFHYLKKITDYEFPELVLDRNLEDDVLEVHGKGLHGRISVYSEKFRQEHSQVENLWTLMNSLTTKLKVTVHAKSELGEQVCKKDKKVFVDVNFENHSIQVKKRMNTDEVLPILDALVSSFEYPAPRHCAQLRLVSRVRDDSTRKQLDEMLNDFLKKKSDETSPAAAAGTGDNILSEHQESESLLLHAFDDQWHESSKIVLKTPKVEPAGKETEIEYFRYKETTTELFAQLYKIFTDAAQGSDFLRWLEDVYVEYGKKKKRLHSLMECRFPFLLDKRCHMYFHGQWLSFHSDFHSHLEVHFLELLKTRSIEPSYLILPLPWPQSEKQKKQNGGEGGEAGGAGPRGEQGEAGGGGPRGEQGEAGGGEEKRKTEKTFARFLAVWLERKNPTDDIFMELQGKEPYKKLMECLRSCKMGEPAFNEMFALVGQLMLKPKDRGFIVGDGVTLKGGLELFDLLYYDEKRVFFIHVKKGFSAKNMRIVVDQVRQSAEFLQCLIFRGREACVEELTAFFRKLKFCTMKKGKCTRHQDRKWACEANAAGTKELDASKFAELLNSREKHFVLAYGGTTMTQDELDEITGRKVDDVLKKHEEWVERLASKGYATRAGATEESTNYALTSRFCVETKENFAECMKNDEEEMTDQSLLDMFRDLKGAISTTETSAGKMAFLNLFGSFSNYQNMTLHFCRIDYQFPTDEAIQECITFFEKLSIHTSG